MPYTWFICGDFNLAVWQIFIGSPNLNYNKLIYFSCIAHGMAKLFIWPLRQNKGSSVHCETET